MTKSRFKEKRERAPVEVLVCGTSPRRLCDGWAFPRAVRDLLIAELGAGPRDVLHLFGGRADFGTRMDIDPRTGPHVIGDAWRPPFERDSFRAVVMDPPYTGAFATMSNQKSVALFAGAAWVARERVVWFHPTWLGTTARCSMERAWLVNVGRSCVVRALQFFKVPGPDRKLKPFNFYIKGPAIKYNHWLKPNMLLPFDWAARGKT